MNAASLAEAMIAKLPDALQAAQIAGQGLLDKIKPFATTEGKKLATQLVAIEQGPFSEPLSKLMLKMQLQAFESALVGLVEVTLFQVQELINALLKIIRETVNGAIGFALL